jgi:MFS family permease
MQGRSALRGTPRSVRQPPARNVAYLGIGVVGEMIDDARAPTRPPLISGPQDRRALVTMTLGHGIQHFYVAGLAVTYPFVVEQFHISYAVLGAVLTVAGLAGGLLQGAAGLLRGMSAKVVLTLQNCGLAAAALLGGVAPGFGLFGGARVLGAVASWPQHPVGSSYLSERFPHRRATVLSWHTAGGSFGTVVVPLIASAVIATAGWRWALFVLAIALGLGALLMAVALPPDVTSKSTDAEGGSRPKPASLRDLLRRREVVAVLVASTIAAGGRGLGTLSAFLPAYLRSGLHLSPLTVGVLFSLVMAASIGGPLLGGVLADRHGRTRTLITTYVAGAAALVGFAWVGANLVAVAVLGVCVGLLAYTESPLLQSVFSDLTAEGSSRSAFGAFFAIAYGVGSLWTALLGWIITVAGFAPAFTVMAGSFLAAAAVIARFIRT